MLLSKKQTAIYIICISIFMLVISTHKAIASDILSPWTNLQPLPYPIANQAAFINNNILSIIAGSTTTATSNIAYSKIDNTGNLSLWSYSNNFPEAIYWHTLSKKDNFIYVIGGATYPPANSVNHVYKGTITDGFITSWTQLNTLPEPNSMGNTIIANSKIYSIGGYNMTNGSYDSFSNKVFMADVLDDGNIGPWVQTLQLPKSIFGFGVININNKIITIGGRDESNTSISTIYQADIQPNGAIGSWKEIGNLPQPITNAGITVANNTIYVVGGADISPLGQVHWLNTVYYASLNGDGTIENWNTSQYSLPKTICCGSMLASNNNLYLIGGYDGISGSYINDVYKSKFQEISTPNPFPSLNVPDIKQYTPPWNLYTYDHGNLWSTNPTIQKWGCALTSADMLLRYYGFSIDPGELNNWLKNQPDGYLRNGLLNWLAISRYSKLNSSNTIPALEFMRLNGNDNLINELKSNRPVILEEPGHFIVAKSQNETTFGINDPAYPNRSTLDSYNNLFNSIISFIPSHTDLSYIILTINPEFDMKIFDTNDIEINKSIFVENPLADDTGMSTTTNQPLKIFEFSKPQNGTYKIKITGNGIYQLDSYLYNIEGNVNLTKNKGILGINQTNELTLTIGEENSTKVNISIEQVINDWDNAKIQGMIKNEKKYQQIKSSLKFVSVLIKKGQIKLAKIVLFVTGQTIKAFTNKFVDKTASEILQSEISLLIKKL